MDITDSDLAAPGTADIKAFDRTRIRSFVKRAGRTTSGQARALDKLGPRFLIPFQLEPLDMPTVFGRTAPVVLEIGFGMGEATTQIAKTLPDTDFIGCEVHVPGVGSLLRLLGEHEAENVRIVQYDAVEVLRHMVAPDSLEGVHVFFPDPWHKVRHNKRRLIQAEFCTLVASRVRPGGYLHCATDWEPYAEHMLEVLSQHPAWRNTATDFAGKPDYRPLTKFEQRGLRLGHGVRDLVFERR
ncbi:tRNA (guanosine(46)-N7)-methyltransferase TrmB [soil metagenome]